MTHKAHLGRTLEELEGDRWGEPSFPSHLVTECDRLRKIQLHRFTIENLRMMIGQNIGSRYLVPIAVDRLEVEPFVEGDFYPGDLLCTVLSLPNGFWVDNPDLRGRAAALAAAAIAAISAPGYEHGQVVAKRIRKAYDAFTANG